VNFISGKSKEQQELQSLVRMHQLSVKHKVAYGNQLCSLLLEAHKYACHVKSSLINF